ncbi:hypothetical protein M9H77_23544 [Catharanthus roseus]|uniref:Uncharacterized protein n=1 Tax=Catharanthus roseus TaxID=4058 RepID=A0ACC0AUD0_CATRO|nr:hypothetical protein M9H77_23544 [Catharanthus roseus]
MCSLLIRLGAKTGKFIIQWWGVHKKEGVAQEVANLDRVSLIEEEYALALRLMHLIRSDSPSGKPTKPAHPIPFRSTIWRALGAFVAISFGCFLGLEVKDIMTTGRNLVLFAILILEGPLSLFGNDRNDMNLSRRLIPGQGGNYQTHGRP